MNTSRFYSSKKIMLYRTFVITSRTVLFLFLFSIMMFILFIMGNYQHFTDKNQAFIIKIAAASSTMLCIASFFNIFCSVFFFFIKRRTRYLITAFLMLFSSALGFFAAALLQTVEIISHGIQ